MRIDAEIAVAGAGPAGARAAELLSRAGAEVILLDPRAPWEKPCGGGLTAAAFRSVPELNEIRPRARRIDCVRLEAPDGSAIDVALDEPLVVIARRTLAEWQLERAVRAGAVFESERIERVDAASRGWILKLAGGGEVRVRRVVGADGAASRIRRALAPQLDIELAPTRLLFAGGEGRTPNAIVLRFFRDVHGYAWNFPRIGHRSIGIGLEPGHWSRSRLDRQLDGYADSWGRCTCVRALRAGAVIGTARNRLARAYPGIAGADWALVGDAAGFADPATGEGIQNALRSATLLAEAYEADGSFGRYPRRAWAAFEREFRVARLVRRIVYAGDAAGRLIGAASRGRLAHAFLAAIVNGGNEHDPALMRRFARAIAAHPGRGDSRGIDRVTEEVRGGSPTAASQCTGNRCSQAPAEPDVCSCNRPVSITWSDRQMDTAKGSAGIVRPVAGAA